MTLYTPTATLTPSGKQFLCVPERSILDAALSAGIALPYRCANGSCGDCRARVLSGEVSRLKFHDFALSEAEKIAGVCLLCSNTASTDVLLQVEEANSVTDIPEQTLRARRCRVDYLDQVTAISFKFLRGKAFRFLPGQSATLSLPDGMQAELPIASCPCNSSFVEFHFPLAQGNPLLDMCESSLALSNLDKVTVSGPCGDFTLSSDVHTPKLFIAIGEGFAAIQALIEHVFNLDAGTPCTLLWLASETVAHYRHDLCRSWTDAIDEFRYIPAASVEHALPELQSILASQQQLEVYLSSKEAAQSLPNKRLNDLLSCLTSSGASISMI